MQRNQPPFDQEQLLAIDDPEAPEIFPNPDLVGETRPDDRPQANLPQTHNLEVSTFLRRLINPNRTPRFYLYEEQNIDGAVFFTRHTVRRAAFLRNKPSGN